MSKTGYVLDWFLFVLWAYILGRAVWGVTHGEWIQILMGLAAVFFLWYNWKQIKQYRAWRDAQNASSGD
jgi:hypothetical protein